jgi:hypothetical protein
METLTEQEAAAYEAIAMRELGATCAKWLATGEFGQAAVAAAG